MHKYTDEEKKFLSEFVPGHSHKEICEAFNDRFKTDLTIMQIKGSISRYKLNTGRTGHFEKYHVPCNKGVKGICHPGCIKTQFKKGNVPTNHRPVGSERVSKDGYIEIKVAEPNKWDLKHRVVWEEKNGPIPKGYAILFKDQNKLNISLDNLSLVSRKELIRLIKNNLLFSDPDLTMTGINIARVMAKVSDIKLRR